MSTIFQNKININGVEYKRINMIDSIKLQSKIAGALAGINVSSDNVQEIGKQAIQHILKNTDDIIGIIKLVTGASDEDLETFEAGMEYDILSNLVDHPDVKKIIENIKKSMGKLTNKMEK